MKTSHKSDELKKLKKGRVHKSGTYGQENKKILIIGKLKSVLKYSSNAYQIHMFTYEYIYSMYTWNKNMVFYYCL